LRHPAAVEPRRIELLLKLFLASDTPDIAGKLLATCREQQRALLAHYASIEAELDALAATRPANVARFRATVRYGVRVADALLYWTEEAEALVGPPPKLARG
jgi:hypothetical protein